MKKLRRMEHGETLTIIYLKMQLASLRNGGAIAFEGMDGSLAEELSYQIDEPESDVATTISFLMRYGLMEQIDGGDVYVLPSAVQNTGSETDSAARMREFRERQASHCDGGASLCSDIKRESRKEIYREPDREGEPNAAAPPPAPARDENGLIFLTDKDYEALQTELGTAELKRVIQYLSTYCRTNGKQYKDWPFVIRRASREGWGKPDPSKGASKTISPGTDLQPTQDRIQKNNDWLDAFLAEQAAKEAASVGT